MISLLVAQTICDTDNPCLNGKHCSSNTSNPTHYTCDCGDWFEGVNCGGIVFLFLSCRGSKFRFLRYKSLLFSFTNTSCTCFVFSVQLYPCDSEPCVNGGSCSNDDKDVSLYHCHCIDDYSGKNCQGTRFLRQ